MGVVFHSRGDVTDFTKPLILRRRLLLRPFNHVPSQGESIDFNCTTDRFEPNPSVRASLVIKPNDLFTVECNNECLLFSFDAKPFICGRVMMR